MTAIDPAASRITLDDGRRLGFDRLLLTTGVEPRRIPVPGADLDGVYYLRTLAHCDVLRKRLDTGGHVVVVGAGWIGSKFAASARQRGLEVTVIDPVALPNERIFGSEIGSFYRDLHLQHGIELVLGDGVESFEGDQAMQRGHTAGRTFDCDFAVVGIGVAPRNELASRSARCGRRAGRSSVSCSRLMAQRCAQPVLSRGPRTWRRLQASIGRCPASTGSPPRLIHRAR